MGHDRLRELEEETVRHGKYVPAGSCLLRSCADWDDETLREQVCSLEMEIGQKDRQIENICTGLLSARPPQVGTSDSSQQP